MGGEWSNLSVFRYQATVQSGTHETVRWNTSIAIKPNGWGSQTSSLHDYKSFHDFKSFQKSFHGLKSFNGFKSFHALYTISKNQNPSLHCVITAPSLTIYFSNLATEINTFEASHTSKMEVEKMHDSCLQWAIKWNHKWSFVKGYLL